MARRHSQNNGDESGHGPDWRRPRWLFKLRLVSGKPTEPPHGPGPPSARCDVGGELEQGHELVINEEGDYEFWPKRLAERPAEIALEAGVVVELQPSDPSGQKPTVA